MQYIKINKFNHTLIIIQNKNHFRGPAQEITLNNRSSTIIVNRSSYLICAIEITTFLSQNVAHIFIYYCASKLVAKIFKIRTFYKIYITLNFVKVKR